MRYNFIRYFILKSFALISFVLSTPLLLKGLGSTEFGIWSTLSSFVGWVLVFDFGIGNYLRNKISECEVQRRQELIRQHLLRSLILTIKGALITGVVLAVISYFIQWEKLLGVASSGKEILCSVFLIIIFTSFSFISNLVFFYFYGIQKSYIVAFLQSLSHVLFVLVSYLLFVSGLMNLESVALSYGVTLILPGIIASIYVAADLRLWETRELNSQIDKEKSLSLGNKFFFIQLTGLVLFSTDKLILANIFGPKTVTQYEVLFKVFSIPLLIQSIVNTPSWGKYSKDYFSKNIPSIKKLIKMHLLLFLCFGFFLILLGLTINPILKIWLNTQVLDSLLVRTMVLFICIMIWNNIFAIFLNATNNIDLTFKICVFVVVVNIPLSYLLAQSPLRESGIVIGTIICLLPAAILTPIQTIKILKKYA